MSKHVIGIDGCRGGWLICRINVVTAEIDLVAFVRQLREVVDSEDSATHIAIDIPIGLPEAGRSRKVDREARKLLTSLRGSSVFPAPARELLNKLTYSEANGHSRAVCGKGLSRQAHAIFPKIAEVDEIMIPEMQDRVFEVHPEVCFWGLANGPMQYAKKTLAGYEERHRLLKTVLSTEIPDRSNVRRLR